MTEQPKQEPLLSTTPKYFHSDSNGIGEAFNVGLKAGVSTHVDASRAV